MTLKAGDKAPDFTLPDQDGNPVRLSALLGKQPVVLFFYPKDHTPICTREVCAFRDSFDEVTKAGAAVLGVCFDPPASHKAFAEKHALPYPLLSDEKKEARQQYGIGLSFGFMPERVTFVIDKEGVIRHVYNAQLRAARHAEEALAALKRLS